MNVQAPNPFLRFWSLGYRRLVPIVPPGASISPKSALAKRPGSIGKAVGVQRRDGSWSGMDWIPYTASENDLRDWHAMGAGAGLKTGAGIVALDIDTLHQTVGDLVQALAAQMLGPAPLRWGREPKRLMLYRAPPDTPYMRVIFDDGLPAKVGKEPRVELLTDQRQCVVHGVHPDTGRPYRWEGLCPLDELTTVTAEQLRAFFARLAAELPAARVAVDEAATDRQHVNQEALRGRSDLVVEAVRRLPNTVDLFPTYDDYIRVGAAIKGALPDDPDLAEECFVEWAARFEGDDDFDPARAAADLRRVKPPFALGASWLYDQAERHGGAPSFVAGTWFDAAAAPSPAEAGGLLFGLADDPADRPKPVYEFVTLDEAAEGALSTSVRPLIKGLLDCGALSVLYGESNTGKTFVAMDMAYHVAVGRPWGGMKAAKAVVVYVAAEGGRGARKRAAALKAKYGPCADFHYLLAPVNLLDPQADIGPLIAAIRERFPTAGLIVIDTLSRAMSGGDENSSVDMGRLVSHFDRIRQATAAHVMVVHHSGKDRAKGARGHSLLRAALDTEIEIADGEISVQKQRDLDKSWSSGFDLDTVTLGVDEDGDPITSCTIRLTAKARVQVGVPTPKERDILEVVTSLQATSPNPDAGVPATEIARCCGADTTVDTVRTHLRRLAAKGHLCQAERGRWRLRKSGEAAQHTAEELAEINSSSIFD